MSPVGVSAATTHEPMQQLISFPLRHHVGNSTIGHPHARDRRRLLAVPSLVSARLSGDIMSHGYFSAEITVGTPPQRFSLIVDTGSSITAVPCAECARCGEHANPKFRPTHSHTFARVGCEQREYGCTSCHDRACAYHVAYQEGSSYSGYLATDVVRLGAGGACAALRFAFGCATAESGHFRSQQADGIMGLASTRHASRLDALGVGGASATHGTRRRTADAGRAGAIAAAATSHAEATSDDTYDDLSVTGAGHSPTVLEALVDRGVVADGFSLCIGWGGGSLSFGLPAPPSIAAPRAKRASANASRLVIAPAQSAGDGDELWAQVVDGAYYAVSVSGVAYGGRPIGEAPSSTIIDSGTTFMYMHSAAFRPLLAVLRATRCEHISAAPAPRDEFCVHVAVPDDPSDDADGSGWSPMSEPPSYSSSSAVSGRTPPGSARAILDGCFEPVSVAFDVGALSMRPSQYFYTGDGVGEWCAGIFDNYEEGLVLGTINLMDRLVTFDRANRRWVLSLASPNSMTFHGIP